MSGPTLHSGEEGTTGREVFEHSTATGPGPGYGKDHGESATTGFEGSTGFGAGGREHHHHETSGGTPAKTGSAGHDIVGGIAGAAGRQSEGADPHAKTGAHLPGTTGTGGGIPPPAPGQGRYDEEAHHGHSHHQHSSEGAGIALGAGAIGAAAGGIGGSDRSNIASSYGNESTGTSGGHVDRVGDLNQSGAMYERTTNQGPVTGGAAGTDRFDTDKRSGVQTNTEKNNYPDLKESTNRAEGKSEGGLMGVLGTSDKDFTGRERLGGASGAYADTHGKFQDHTTGPHGASALTGREGNIAKNPVAQATGVTNEQAGAGAAPVKEGLMDKIKHAFH